MKKILIFLFFAISFGCKKELNLKPNTSIVLPKTAQELESLLENSDELNTTTGFGQVSADEYFIPSLIDWQSAYSATVRNASIWQREIYAGDRSIQDWLVPYTTIFYANSVLDILKTQDIKSDTEKSRIKGRALFMRAYAFYALVSIFSKGYDPLTAPADLGIPLKLNGNVDEIVQRSSVEQTYDQIIKDGIEAAESLNQDIVINKRNQPSKVAAYAFLARVLLSMRNYTQAEVYADKSLALYSKLTNFNTLSKTASSAFTANSEEIIYYSRAGSQLGSFFIDSYGTYGVDPELISLYLLNDLRLNIYYRIDMFNNYRVKPINDALGYAFTGLATDEIYLIKAECLARRGEIISSMDFLNRLNITRWDANATTPSHPYQNITANSTADALNKVLIERRKALVWRGIRWTDLKRLNLEGRNITLTRNLSGTIYTLKPNSPLYVLPIPDDEIALSGIQQNNR
ncbi:MAG: RagB/SusD family nutrient uptake outer membrane protein [Bacteroidota bacterium]